jgi:hypothetical protein
MQHYTDLNTIQHIYQIRNNVWPVGRADFAKALTVEGGPGFESHKLHIILINKPWPIKGCHVATHDWATWHPNTCPNDAMCQNTIRLQLPIKNAMSSHATSVYGRMASATSACTNCTVSFPFLHV